MTCSSGKISYATAALAWDVIQIRLSQKSRYTHKRKGLEGTAYRCPECRQWHLTSADRVMRKPQRERESWKGEAR
ncbi:hypothetical protein [Candidatus Contendibacter odensensis]|uniref:Uncharacterized protein n=1 Tax=Candidatus Contendobacter odensis Run_B_J11 TaxID=1400861 RepID=A0A7U7GEN1_9GAMM|nr:hypothetical protein [Candidatus Contendobacter odensis]CDH46990.1 hypothetical protein BN874_690040 [Candidatus Contendobacter odensis Run_B_J11]